jgi:hypothetical protein
MSLSRETMLELMALADGELEGQAKERAEALAAQSGVARRVVESMRDSGIRVWLGEALEEQARSADGIADAVMAKIAAASAGVPSALPGHAQKREAPAGTRRLPAARPWRRSRVAVVGAALGSALAIAAAVAIHVRTGEQALVARAGAPGGETRAPEPSPTTLPRQAGPSPARGVEVEEIDSPSHVSIFEISAVANAAEPSSVVVWIDDEPGER